MFGKKELQRELEQKEQQIQELNRRIKEYQDKNDAVVSALTDAKSAANRIIGAAEAKRDDIIAAAMREKADMEAQRDGILDEARAQAAAIVADAEKRAKAAEEQARYFQDYIRNTADTVRRQAENYAGFLENYEHIGVGQQPETDQLDTPDQYRTLKRKPLFCHHVWQPQVLHLRHSGLFPSHTPARLKASEAKLISTAPRD